MQTSIIELNQNALEHNINFLKNQFNRTKLSSVVKSNAYGHGLPQFLQIAAECGIDHFSVFSSWEAIQTFENLKSPADIMIMGWINPDHMDWVIENDIEFFIFGFDRIEKVLEITRKLKKPAKIHIEIETGMNRTGFQQRELKKLIPIIKNNKEHFILKGLCTHLAGAESIANYYRVKDQMKVFNRVYKKLIENDLKPERRHSACSAAALGYPKTQFEMVRIGILQYGFWPSTETYIQYLTRNKLQEDPLEQVLSWKSEIMSIKKVKTGEFVGYGTSYLAQKNMTIAIIPVGYAHGYTRSLSNHGRVLIHGQRVGIIGMVNMNMCVADVTVLENVKVGDEVVLIGRQGDLKINVSAFTELSDELNYELLTRLPAEIHRRIIKDTITS